MEKYKNKLWKDLTTDIERAEFIECGRAWETGIIAKTLENDLAKAYRICAMGLNKHTGDIIRLLKIFVAFNKDDFTKIDYRWLVADVAKAKQILDLYENQTSETNNNFGTSDIINTVLQKVIQWTIENAENIESTNGDNNIVIDHEEMRKNFDDWLEEEKQQIIDAVKYGFKDATCVNPDNSFDVYYKNTFGDMLPNKAEY
jgi:hypothetical protein